MPARRHRPASSTRFPRQLPIGSMTKSCIRICWAHLPIEGGASGMDVSPCALARVHGQVARATLLASRARARRHRQSGDAPDLSLRGAANAGNEAIHTRPVAIPTGSLPFGQQS